MSTNNALGYVRYDKSFSNLETSRLTATEPANITLPYDNVLQVSAIDASLIMGSFVGDVTGNLEGDVTGNLEGDTILVENIKISNTAELLPGATISGAVLSSALPPSLQSIGSLSTTVNQMLYTTAGSTYAAANISPYSRNNLGLSSAASWQSNLSLVPGTHVQPQSVVLSGLAAQIVASDTLMYGSGVNAISTTPFTAAGRNLVGGATAANQRTTLGLGTISTLPAPSGTVVGTTDSQTLVNKTILSSTNTVGATHLFATGGATVQLNTNPIPSAGQVLTAVSPSEASWQSAPFSGPGSSTDNAVARYDGVSGKLVKNSGVLIDDSNNVSGVGTLTAASVGGTLTTAAQPNVTSLGTLTGVVTSGNIILSTPGATVDGIDLTATVGAYPANLTSLTNSEVSQLANINGTVISSANWTYLASLDQDLGTTNTPTFNGLDANGGVVSNVGPPVANTDAATKLYVDNTAQGFQPIDSSPTASTANVSGTYASGSKTLTEIGGPSALTIDGNLLGVGERVLLKDQTSLPENGVYTVVNNDGVGAWVLVRATDFDETAEISNGKFVFVTGGTLNANTGWVVFDLDPSFVLDAASPTGDIPFSQVSGSSSITAGTGMTQTGTTFNVNGTAGRISVGATSVNIDAGYVGQGSITTLGTLTAGTWNADTVAISYGGTGATTAGAALANLGGQPLDNTLTGLSSVAVGAADLMLYSTGTDTFATSAITAAGRSLAAGATAADQRTTLGLGTIAVLPAPSGTVVGTTDLQTLTNKTLVDSSTVFQDQADPTKRFLLEASGITTATTRVLTIPDATGVVVLEDNIVTLSNKTLTGATLTDPANTVYASDLLTSAGNVNVSAAANPTAGQVLTATSASAATWQNVLAQSLERVITVAQSGGDYTSIGAALTAASALTPAANNRVLIQVAPGTYTETNPLAIPQYVVVKGLGRANNVRVMPVTDTAPIFSMSLNSAVQTVTAQGASGVGGVGFLVSDASTFCVIAACAVVDCETGFKNTSSSTVVNSSNLSITNCTAINGSFPGVTAVGFESTSGCSFVGVNLTASGFFGGNISVAGFRCSGENASMNIRTSQASFCAKGIVVENGVLGSEAVAQFNSMLLLSNGEGVEVGANASCDLVGTNIQSTTGLYDINVSSASATLYGSGNEWRIDKTFFTPGSIQYITHISSTPNDEAFVIQAELSVGTVNQKRESAFGGGDSHTIDMYVRSTSDGVTFTNYDAEAASFTGPAFPFWQGTGVGNIIYIGGGREPFPGTKVLVETAPDFTTGSFVSEYWNGATWTEMKRMITEANPPYLPRRMYSDNTSYQIRSGPTPNWTQTTVDGQLAYWKRYRITSPITAAGTAKQFKLHTDRTEINSTGFMEYYGKARVRHSLGEFIHSMQGPNNSVDPANRNLYMSSRVGSAFVDNAYSGTTDERTGTCFNLFFSTDTSYPLRLTWKFRADASGGQTQWTVYYGYATSFEDDTSAASILYTTAGSAPVSGPNEQTVTVTTPTAPTAITAGRIYTASVECDISTMLTVRNTGSNTGDTFWVALERNGSTDTNNGDAQVFSVNVSVVRWSHGEFLPE